MSEKVLGKTKACASDRREGEEPVLELRKISKSFGGVRALDEVDFRLYLGEVVGLVGDNGAGKSTLMKVM
ncbi:MAG: ATP-binding cassette domain-containing protein, partial [Chloroflexota bacterium]